MVELGGSLPASRRLDRVHKNLNLGRALGREDEAVSVVVRVVGIRTSDVGNSNLVLDALRTQHAHKVSGHPVWHVNEGQNAISSDASRRTAGIHLDAASGKPIAHGLSAQRPCRSGASCGARALLAGCLVRRGSPPASTSWAASSRAWESETTLRGLGNRLRGRRNATERQNPEHAQRQGEVGNRGAIERTSDATRE